MKSVVSVSSEAEVGIVGEEKGKRRRRVTEEEKKKAGLALVKQGLTGEGSKRKENADCVLLIPQKA